MQRLLEQQRKLLEQLEHNSEVADDALSDDSESDRHHRMICNEPLVDESKSRIHWITTCVEENPAMTEVAARDVLKLQVAQRDAENRLDEAVLLMQLASAKRRKESSPNSESDGDEGDVRDTAYHRGMVLAAVEEVRLASSNIRTYLRGAVAVEAVVSDA